MVHRSIRTAAVRRLGRGQLDGQRSAITRQKRSNPNGRKRIGFGRRRQFQFVVFVAQRPRLRTDTRRVTL